MKAIIYNKEFNAKEVNGKYFYYAPKAMRWIPTSVKNIVNE